LMREFCPGCNTIRNMVKTTATKTITDSDGKPNTIKTIILRCEKCNLVVRSKILRGIKI
jgi:hypothetical protein